MIRKAKFGLFDLTVSSSSLVLFRALPFFFLFPSFVFLLFPLPSFFSHYFCASVPLSVLCLSPPSFFCLSLRVSLSPSFFFVWVCLLLLDLSLPSIDFFSLSTSVCLFRRHKRNEAARTFGPPEARDASASAWPPNGKRHGSLCKFLRHILLTLLSSRFPDVNPDRATKSTDVCSRRQRQWG